MQDTHQVSKIVHADEVSKSDNTSKQVEQTSTLAFNHAPDVMQAHGGGNVSAPLTWPIPPTLQEELAIGESASGHESSSGRLA